MEKNANIYANIGLITEAAVQSQGNDFSTNFGIFPRKQPWQNAILIQLQALQFH